MTTGSLRVPATGALADLLACPPPLLDVTLDQLRTLLAVREAGSPLAAARILGREHSSVRKQLDTLNRTFQQLCGEALVVKQGRGQDYLFTPTGDAMAQIATRMFSSGWPGSPNGADGSALPSRWPPPSSPWISSPRSGRRSLAIHSPRDRAEHRSRAHPRLPPNWTPRRRPGLREHPVTPDRPSPQRLRHHRMAPRGPDPAHQSPTRELPVAPSARTACPPSRCSPRPPG